MDCLKLANALGGCDEDQKLNDEACARIGSARAKAHRRFEAPPSGPMLRLSPSGAHSTGTTGVPAPPFQPRALRLPNRGKDRNHGCFPHRVPLVSH
jgi:hypothetical protein